jgi:hypothetical protein
MFRADPALKLEFNLPALLKLQAAWRRFTGLTKQPQLYNVAFLLMELTVTMTMFIPRWCGPLSLVTQAHFVDTFKASFKKIYSIKSLAHYA